MNEDYELVSGDDELAVYKYVGKNLMSPLYVIQDSSGNSFPIEGDGELTYLKEILAWL